MAVIRVLQIKPGGLLWIALECSGHVWIGRYGTGRSAATPAGDARQDRIRIANVCIGMAATLMTLAWLRGVYVVLENPPGSTISKLEPLATVLRFIQGSTEPVGRTYLAA